MTILRSTSIAKAGENFVLTCQVNVTDYLTVEPTVQWSGGSVGSGNGVMVGGTTHSGFISMRTLTFSPLRTSHIVLYICQADINIPSIDLRKKSYIQYILLIKSKSFYREVIVIPTRACSVLSTYYHAAFFVYRILATISFIHLTQSLHLW